MIQILETYRRLRAGQNYLKTAEEFQWKLLRIRESHLPQKYLQFTGLHGSRPQL